MPSSSLKSCSCATQPGRQSAPTRTQTATDRKHGLGQTDGRFQSKNPCRHSTYLIGTAKNRHRGPLSRSGSDVPAQQLSRYAGAAVWPAGRRPHDNLPAAGQPNSRVRARRCIQRPVGVRHGRGRAREVERWRRTCARTSSPPPNSSPKLSCVHRRMESEAGEPAAVGLELGARTFALRNTFLGDGRANVRPLSDPPQPPEARQPGRRTRPRARTKVHPLHRTSSTLPARQPLAPQRAGPSHQMVLAPQNGRAGGARPPRPP